MAPKRSHLTVVVRRAEGVLVRVLGLVVRRGFEPVGVTVRMDEDAARFLVGITVEGERPTDVLVRHLGNLYDVERVLPPWSDS